MPAGKMVPRSLRHDFFGLFDILAAYPSGRRALYQVTTLGNLSHRRRKMLAALPPFQFHGDDAILAYVPGRRRHFRVCYADDKFEWRIIVWSVPPDVKKPRVRARVATGSEVPAGAA